MKNLLLAFALIAMTAPAIAQDAPPPAPEMETIKIPKTKGAWMIVPIQPQPLTIQFSNAKACEDERARILKASQLNSFCIWVN